MVGHLLLLVLPRRILAALAGDAEQRKRGSVRGLSFKSFLFRKYTHLLCRQSFFGWRSSGRSGLCVAESYFIGCKSSIISLVDSSRGSQVTGEAVSRNVILLQITSIWNYMFGLQPDAHIVNKEVSLPRSLRNVLVSTYSLSIMKESLV